MYQEYWVEQQIGTVVHKRYSFSTSLPRAAGDALRELRHQQPEVKAWVRLVLLEEAVLAAQFMKDTDEPFAEFPPNDEADVSSIEHRE